MRVQINCHNPECLAKDSVASISYHDNKTKSDKLGFVLCLKCSWPSQLDKLQTNNSLMKILVIGAKDEYEIEKLEAKHTPKCIICKTSKIKVTEYRKPTIKEAKQMHKNNPHETLKDMIENREMPYEITKQCITKLYIESERFRIKRKYVGYACENCERIILLQSTPKVNWKPIGWLKESGQHFGGIGCYKCSKIVKFATLGAYPSRWTPNEKIEPIQVPRITKVQIRRIVKEELEKYGVIKA